MNFLELAKKRYSVRDFQTKKVEEEKLKLILEAGRVAPTGANRQPFKLIVAQSEQSLEKLGKAANIYGAPLAFIVCGDHRTVWKRPYDSRSILDIDVSIVTDHMMLQATELGLGSLWICYFKPDVIKADFNLPDYLEPINILAVGYANGQPQSPDRHATTRKPLTETVAYETL